MCARNGDVDTDGGGAIQAATLNVFVNGIPISVVGDLASPDSSCKLNNVHCRPYVVAGSLTVFAGGKAVHRVGDQRACGATSASGSPNTFIGD